MAHKNANSSKAEMNKRMRQAEKVLPMNSTTVIPPRTSHSLEKLARSTGKSPHLFIGILFSIVSFLMGSRTFVTPPAHKNWKTRVIWWHAVIAYSSSQSWEELWKERRNHSPPGPSRPGHGDHQGHAGWGQPGVVLHLCESLPWSFFIFHLQVHCIR
jgi:hypothetical protein